MTDPVRWVACYDRGMVTRHELISRLVRAAADRTAAEIAPLLTAELLAELRHETLTPPVRPEDVGICGSVCNDGPFDWAAHLREQQRLYQAGAWNWHAYFNNNPEP